MQKSKKIFKKCKNLARAVARGAQDPYIHILLLIWQNRPLTSFQAFFAAQTPYSAVEKGPSFSILHI
jgi:hypothetical protein